MGGQGSKGLPTDGYVGSSLRVGHREIRDRKPRGDDDGIATGSDQRGLQENPLSV